METFFYKSDRYPIRENAPGVNRPNVSEITNTCETVKNACLCRYPCKRACLGEAKLLRKEMDSIGSLQSNVHEAFCVMNINPCVPVAQWLEHCVCSAKVVGSIPREHMY